VALAEMRTLAKSLVEPHKIRWTQAVRALNSADLEISDCLAALEILVDKPVAGVERLNFKCLEILGDRQLSRAETWKFLKMVIDSDFHVRGGPKLAELSLKLLEEISEKVSPPKNSENIFYAAGLQTRIGDFKNEKLLANPEISRSVDISEISRSVWGLGILRNRLPGLDPVTVRRALDASLLAPIQDGGKFRPPQPLVLLTRLRLGLAHLGLQESSVYRNVTQSIDCSFETHNQDVSQIVDALWWILTMGEVNPYPELYSLCANRTDLLTRSHREKALICLSHRPSDGGAADYIEANKILTRKHRSEVNWMKNRTSVSLER